MNFLFSTLIGICTMKTDLSLTSQSYNLSAYLYVRLPAAIATYLLACLALISVSLPLWLPLHMLAASSSVPTGLLVCQPACLLVCMHICLSASGCTSAFMYLFSACKSVCFLHVDLSIPACLWVS
jgi:hypothetical protein